MAGPWEQYSAPQADSPPWVKYGGAPAEEHSAIGDVARGALSKLNPVTMITDAAALAKAGFEHPVDTALQVLGHQYFALKRTKDALMAGKPEEAAAHLNSALSPTGFATEDSEVKMATPGKRAEGFGEMLGTGLAGFFGTKLPQILTGAKGTAGTALRVAGSIPEIPEALPGAAGVAQDLVSLAPGIGSTIEHGIRLVNRGTRVAGTLSDRINAAATRAAIAEIPDRAAPPPVPTQGPVAGPLRPPIWANKQSAGEQPPVSVGPSERPNLPSNRAPYNQDAAPANVVEMPTPQSLPVRPAARPTIAQIEPQPKAYDSKAAVKRQTDQAFKMADILKQADITPGDLADLTMDHWKQVGEATGLGPPSPYSIQRARFELSKITDAPQVSPELAAQLKRKGALSIAQQLADEMQK